jgi:hypothetical protein
MLFTVLLSYSFISIHFSLMKNESKNQEKENASPRSRFLLKPSKRHVLKAPFGGFYIEINSRPRQARLPFPGLRTFTF